MNKIPNGCVHMSLKINPNQAQSFKRKMHAIIEANMNWQRHVLFRGRRDCLFFEDLCARAEANAFYADRC